MNYLVNAVKMRQADENTISFFGLPQLVLMERAALAAKEEILKKWSGILQKGSHVLIAAGNGNNGGDGAALARLLYQDGFQVTLWISGETEKYSEAMRKQMEILEKYEAVGAGRLKITETIADEDYDMTVDALFGIGLSRQLSGIWQEKTRWLDSLSGIKIALDIPSGISADNGRILGAAFRADMTITFGFLKTGMLLYPGKEYCGEIRVCDIGITQESFLGEMPAGITCGEDRLMELYPARRPDSHKGSYGKVLLIAGSIKMPGAALIAGETLFRSGAGMVRILSPTENRDIIIGSLPEAMYMSLTAETDWEALLDWCDTVIAGPGIGTDAAAAGMLRQLFEALIKNQKKIPVVLDADALNLTAVSTEQRKLIRTCVQRGAAVIMTPHMAELCRLLGCDMETLKENRLKLMEDYCRENGVILVSKDAATVVGMYGRLPQHTEEEQFFYYINQTGNNGMATAGSGDVLSGILGASAALEAVQKAKEEQNFFYAALRGVYLHGLAGDKAARTLGKAGMKAGDIISALPGLLSEL